MTVKIFSRELLKKEKPKVAFPRGLRMRDHVRETAGSNHVYEFIGTDSFGKEWNERRRYEINAGREEEPILYTPLYDTISDATLPKNVPVYRMGPAGVILEEIHEGGEVKFATISSSEFSVPIKHYGVGLEYSKDLVVYNELWNVPIVERQLGIAYNALLNHVHFSPILSASYTAANQTPANTSGSTTVEDFMLTLEDAIIASVNDQTNPRRGPFILLCATPNVFTIEKALTRVPQQGVSLQSSAIDQVRGVIAYDGWTGKRGHKSVTYPGVSSGKAYLISQQYRGEDFQSYMKQDLTQEGTEEDLSRFMTQVVYDTYFGVYANPLRAVEEITWPT